MPHPQEIGLEEALRLRAELRHLPQTDDIRRKLDAVEAQVKRLQADKPAVK